MTFSPRGVTVVGVYIFQQNGTLTIKNGGGLVRCSVYRPRTAERLPMLITYGPYGTEIRYKERCGVSRLSLYSRSCAGTAKRSVMLAEVNDEHKSAHSTRDMPDPGFWTGKGHTVIRSEERCLG